MTALRQVYNLLFSGQVDAKSEPVVIIIIDSDVELVLQILLVHKIILFLEGDSMKLRAMGLMMLAGYTASANAESITTTKKSGGQQVSDSLYGDVETRLTSHRYFDANGNTQANRDLALRPKLGTKIMNERLDLNLTLPVVNKQSSAISKQAQPEALADFTIYSSDRLLVSLNTTNFMATSEAKYDGYLDLDITFKRKFDKLSVGAVTASLMLEAESNLTTNRADADIVARERSDGLSLTGAEPVETPEQKETVKSLYVYPKVAFEPAIVPGLTLAVASYMGPSYKPKYEQTIDAQTGETTTKNVGYEVRAITQNRYTISYAINDQVSVYNQLRQNLKGYQESRVDDGKASIENRTGLTVTLF